MTCCRRGAGSVEIDGEGGVWFPWVISAAVLGNALESYLLTAFESLGAEVGASLLPEDYGSPSGGLIGVGLTVRFLGGLVIGLVADRRGAARVLQASCIGLAGAALLLGVLPSFSFMGWISPVCLVIVWSLGAMAASAQFPAAALLAFDLAPPRFRGLCSSLVLCSSYIGSCFASLVVLILRSANAGTSSPWRVVFLLGSVLGALFFCLQRLLLPVSLTPDRGEGSLGKKGEGQVRRFAAAALACTGWMVPANVPVHWLPAFLPKHGHAWSSVQPQLLCALVHGHLAALLVLAGLLCDLVQTGFLCNLNGRALVLASGHSSSLLWPLLLWWMADAPELFSGFAAYMVLNASLSLAGGPLLAWLVELLSSDMQKRYSRLTNFWNFFQALLGGLAVPTTALLAGPWRGGVVSVGLSCAVAGMIGLRGVLAGLRLDPPAVRSSGSRAAVAYAVVGAPNASTLGHRQDEINDDLEAEFEEELLELHEGCGLDSKSSKRKPPQGTAEEDEDELKGQPLADHADPSAEI